MHPSDRTGNQTDGPPFGHAGQPTSEGNGGGWSFGSGDLTAIPISSLGLGTSDGPGVNSGWVRRLRRTHISIKLAISRSKSYRYFRLTSITLEEPRTSVGSFLLEPFSLHAVFLSGDADRRHDFVVIFADRPGDTSHALNAFLIVRRIAPLTDELEFLVERRAIGEWCHPCPATRRENDGLHAARVHTGSGSQLIVRQPYSAKSSSIDDFFARILVGLGDPDTFAAVNNTTAL